MSNRHGLLSPINDSDKTPAVADVRKHRRTKLRDVLALETKIDARQAAALAKDAEDLCQRYGV